MGINIKKNDTVMVISGKERGKSGRVFRVMPGEGKVLVEKLNIIKRHTRPSATNRQGGIIEKEAPIHTSNVALYCERCARGVRVKVEGRGKTRTRNCIRCGSAISKG